MPGHKGSEFYRNLGYGDLIESLVDFDVTEIPGADNLFNPESVILDVMEKYTELYDVKKSFLSIGGSSNGLIASILAGVNGPKDGIIVARNCHKSVYNGVTLSGAKIFYAYPEMDSEFGILGEITASEIERVFEEVEKTNGQPQAGGDSLCKIKAVVITSPNYYGMLSDIRAIAEVCHKREAALIVDQAHGAHLKFMKKRGSDEGSATKANSADSISWNWVPAEECDADIVVNSTHKTLASFTQTAVVNLCSHRVDEELLGDKLQMIESSSPSYILMTSLDVNGDIIKEFGAELFDGWKENLKWFYGEAMTVEGLRLQCAPNQDKTKILMDMTSLGISGYELEERLREFGIILELSDSKVAMAMTGIGNTREDYAALLEALKEISKSGSKEVSAESASPRGQLAKLSSMGEESTSLGALFRKKRDTESLSGITEKVLLEDSEGRVIARSIIPYPPGAPVIVPGEVMDKETIASIKELISKGEKLLGVDASSRVIVKAR